LRVRQKAHCDRDFDFAQGPHQTALVVVDCVLFYFKMSKLSKVLVTLQMTPIFGS